MFFNCLNGGVFSKNFERNVSIIKIFGFKKIEKLKAKRLPKTRKISVKRTRWIMGTLIGLLVISGPLAFLKVSNVTEQNRHLRSQQKSYEDKLDKAQTGLLAYNPSLGRYLNEFLSVFETRTGETGDYQKWLDSLKPYFATDLDVSKLSVMDNWKAQSLESSELVALYVENDAKIAQMKVSVKTTTGTKEVESGKGKHKKKSKVDVHETQTLFLNIPYAEKNNRYTVVAFPFMTTEQSTVGHIADSLVRNTNEQSDLESADVDSVNTFTTKFLEKYVSSPTKEMEFVMNNPVGLNGAYKVKAVTDTQTSGKPSEPRVSGVVQLEDTTTGAIHAEQFDLSLKKQDGTYFVVKFTH